MAQLIEDTKKECELVYGGNYDIANRYVEPTIFKSVCSESPVMKSEIFGPILPIIVVTNIREACEFVNKGAKPLAVYLFSNSETNQEYVIKNTSSGGVW